ncbi:MAG: hypothetical protein EBT08_14455 [Betaproteobacteria bacterium]|nr:hypothetical protein [Betaproteobacteria bacterium]
MALQVVLAQATAGLDVRAVRLDGNRLCVTVSGPSMAARLRQIEPATVALLRQQGWAVDSLRVRSRTPEPIPEPQAVRPRPPAGAAGALQALAQTLDESALKSGVSRLANALRQRVPDPAAAVSRSGSQPVERPGRGF